MPFRTPGACSLEESTAKVLSAYYKISWFYFFRKIPDPEIQKYVRFISSMVRKQQILRCNDLVCIQVIMKFKNCSFFHNNFPFCFYFRYAYAIAGGLSTYKIKSPVSQADYNLFLFYHKTGHIENECLQ